MPIRWVIGPVIEEVTPGWGTRRYPKVSRIVDPGRSAVPGEDDDGKPILLPKALKHSSVIEAQNWCLSFVRGKDLSALDADPEIDNLFEPGSDYEDVDNYLALTVNALGWTNAKLQGIKDKLEAKGVNLAGITKDSTLRQILAQTGKVIWPNYRGPHGTYASSFFPTIAGGAFDFRLIRGGAGIIVEDSFTIDSPTIWLSNHVPAETGTGWTEVEATGSSHQQVLFTIDRCRATNTVNFSDRALYTAQPGSSQNEYDVEASTEEWASTPGSDDPWFLLGRFTDVNNYYSAGTYGAAAGSDKKIFKKVASVVTELASGDSGVSKGDVFKFEIRGATKKLYKNGGEELSTTDDALTSNGEGGFGSGNAWVAGDDLAKWETDNFKITDAAAPAVSHEYLAAIRRRRSMQHLLRR